MWGRNQKVFAIFPWSYKSNFGLLFFFPTFEEKLFSARLTVSSWMVSKNAGIKSGNAVCNNAPCSNFYCPKRL